MSFHDVSRRNRKKENRDALIPSVLEPDEDSKAYRKNWARLIQKIYEANPLLCPKCQGQMRIISSIEDPEVIKKILKHLGLWSAKRKPSPRANAPPVYIHLDYSDSQIPPLRFTFTKTLIFRLRLAPSDLKGGHGIRMEGFALI